MVRHYLPPGPQGSGKRAKEDINFSQFAEDLDGYSGSDVRLVCKEAAMKPLRRIMKEIDISEEKQSNTGKKNINWAKQVDPATVPSLGQVTQEDVEEALSSTKAAAKVVNNEKYFKWMENYGSV